MTVYKADRLAADRALNRACVKTVALFRAGADVAAVVPVLEAALVTAAVLTEEAAA